MAKADFDIDYDHYAFIKCGPDGMPTKAFVMSADVLSHPGCMAFPDMRPPRIGFPNENGTMTYVNLRVVRITADDLRSCVYPDGEEIFVVLLSRRRAVRILLDDAVRFGRVLNIGGLTLVDIHDPEDD